MPNEVVAVVFLMSESRYTRNIMEVTDFHDYGRCDSSGVRCTVRCQLDMREELDAINRFFDDIQRPMYGVLKVLSPRGKFVDTDLGKAVYYMRNDDFDTKTLTLVIGFDGKEYGHDAN